MGLADASNSTDLDGLGVQRVENVGQGVEGAKRRVDAHEQQLDLKVKVRLLPCSLQNNDGLQQVLTANQGPLTVNRPDGDECVR